MGHNKWVVTKGRMRKVYDGVDAALEASMGFIHEGEGITFDFEQQTIHIIKKGEDDRV